MLKKELKENKYTTIVFIIFLVLFLLGGLLFGLVMPKRGVPVYGNRLDGIEKVEVTKKQTDKLLSDIKSKSYVKDVSTNTNGKIINVVVEVKNGTDVKTAKELGKTVLGAFTDDQKKFFDIQLYLKNENKDAKGYPIIGYKNSSANDFAY